MSVSFFVSCISGLAWPQNEPRGSVIDSRVKMLLYNENQVYRLTAYYGYQIDLQMGTDEEVKTVATGDSVGWQIVGAGQHIFIKPMADRASTNLSVVTDKRTYVFDLVSKPVKDQADMTYFVKFQYPHSGPTINPGSVPKPAADFNFDYKISGNRTLRPIRVFDDGEFTYFQFIRKRERELPAIFLLDMDQKESLVNYRMQGEYVVVERLGETFRLRSGKNFAVVENQWMPTTPVSGEK